MEKKVSIVLGILIVIGLVLAACAAPAENNNAQVGVESEVQESDVEAVESDPTEPIEEEPVETEDVELDTTAIEVVDGLGRTVNLESPAQMVISLAPSNTEILYAVGAGSQVVGREDFSNYPPEVVDLPSVGGSWGELNTEAILALEPDLILAADLTTAEQVQALEDLGLTVFMLPNPVGFEGLFENIRITGTLVGREVEAEALVASLQERVDNVLEVAAGAESQPLVFYELDSTDPNAPWTAGAGTFLDTLITMAKGENLGAAYEGAWVQLNAEEILSRDPEFIILGDAIWGVTPEQVAARTGWEGLFAVQNNQVFPFNDDLASRPGPRLVDGLEELARLIHPELFE